jgi:hypothetical protein
MRRKCPVVALATAGLVLVLVSTIRACSADLGRDGIRVESSPVSFENPVRTTPVDLGPGGIRVESSPLPFVNPVSPTPVGLGTWYVIEWSGFVVLDGWLEASGSSYYAWAGLADPGVSPWTFTAPPEGVYFTITDIETDSDSFAVKDYGVLVGTTPDTGPWDSHEPCYWDPEECMDSDFSHGIFFFGAGEHWITIENKDPRGVTGRGAFRLDTVSDPVDGSTD